MSLKDDYLVFIILLALLVPTHMIFVLDQPVGPVETPQKDTPEAVFQDRISSTGLPVEGRVNSTTLRGMQGYDPAWETFHRRISYQVLKGTYRQYQLRKATGENSDSEDEFESVFTHVENAQSIAVEGTAERFSPEAVLVASAAEGTPLGPLETAYTEAETAYTIHRVNTELQAAQADAFTQIDAQIEAQTASSKRALSVNPGYLEAGKALAYYRYVHLYGTDEEQAAAERSMNRLQNGPLVYRVSRQAHDVDVGLEVVEWRQGGNISCDGHSCEYEGNVTYNDGGAIRYVGGERTPPDESLNTSEYKNRVYFTNNVVKWRTALENNGIDEGLIRFLSGGQFEVEPIAGDERISVRSRSFTDGPPPIPERAALTNTTLSDAEHRQLREMVTLAREHRDSVNETRRRLAASYHYHEWARRPDLETHPGELQTAVRDWYHYRTLVTRMDRVYNPAAYNRSTGTYVDTEARTRAIRAVLAEFESADEFQQYLAAQETGVRERLRVAERSPPGQRSGPVGKVSLAILRTVAFAKASLWGKLFALLNGLAALQFAATVFGTVQWLFNR